MATWLASGLGSEAAAWWPVRQAYAVGDQLEKPKDFMSGFIVEEVSCMKLSGAAYATIDCRPRKGRDWISPAIRIRIPDHRGFFAIRRLCCVRQVAAPFSAEVCELSSVELQYNHYHRYFSLKLSILFSHEVWLQGALSRFCCHLQPTSRDLF